MAKPTFVRMPAGTRKGRSFQQTARRLGPRQRIVYAASALPGQVELHQKTRFTIVR